MTNSTENLSTRIILALRKLNVSQAELARRIGISQQAIQHLCKNKANYSKFTFEIAAALEIDVIWLATGKGYMLPKEDPHKQLMNQQKKLPILHEKEIIKYHLKNNKIEHLETKEWIFSDACTNEKCFGYVLKDKSMYPRLDENTIIVINPEITPKNMDFILAYIKRENAIILRQLQIRKGKNFLVPINMTLYNTIEATSETTTIIGTMCEARWKILEQ